MLLNIQIRDKRELRMENDTDKKLPSDAVELRSQAEERLSEKTNELYQPRTTEDTQRLVHELAVHQVELEMQNEELLQAQQEIELSRDTYVELYDFAPIAYFIFDPHGLIREVNFAGALLLGVERQLLTNKDFVSFIADEGGREAFSNHLETVMQKQNKERCEISLKTKDGALVHGQLKSVTLKTNEGKDGYILTSIADDTIAKQLATEIQDAREYAENIVETVREPMVVLSSELKILTANHSFYETFKVTTEDTIGNFIYDLGNRQWDIPKLRVLFEDILPHNTVFNDYEVEHDFPGIGSKTILLNARQIPQKNIGSQIILLAMEDITARKQADEALLQAGALQKAIFNSANFSSIATDAKGVIQIFNVGAERMLGYTAAEVMNKITPADISDPQEVIIRAEALSIELGTPIAPGFEALVFKASRGIEDIYELTYFRKDGSRFPAVVSVTALRDEQNAIIGYLLIGTDNTARKLIEEERTLLNQALQDKNSELERATLLAEKANRAKSDFLSSMSHELRTPLGAILGFAQLLETSCPEPSLAQKRSIEQILKAGWYLLELINEILDLALIESGRLSMSLEPISLPEIMNECKSMIEPQAEKRGISVTFINVETPCFVKADRTRVKQVLINLLSNAIKYNKAGGTVTVEKTLTSTNSIRISVRDTGEGLSPEQLTMLFQPFNRLGQESNAEQGTGIGLVVSKRLVEWMGGVIGVESTLGKGSLFWIELNLTTGPETATCVDEPTALSPAQGQDDRPMHTLLYVEDNPANMMLVRDIIARRPDIRLLSAVDGKSGIELARASQPDVVLMDINLPGLSGIDAMRILTADPSTAHIPVIALSANAIPRDIEKGLEAGFFRYLTKPIMVNDFMNTLNIALEFAAHQKVKA